MITVTIKNILYFFINDNNRNNIHTDPLYSYYTTDCE